MFDRDDLSTVDFSAINDEGLIDALRTAHGAAAAAQAAEVFAARELYRRRRADSADPGPDGVRGGEFAATEAAVALQVDEATIAALIDIGMALEEALPRTRAAFTAGRIDLAKVRVIVDNTRAVAPEVVADLEPRLLEAAGRTNALRLRQAARRWAARLDPGGTRRRRERRQEERDVRLRAVQDSMAVFDGLLPAPGAQTVAMRLREMSMQVCASDPRTMPQRRADALVALADGSGQLRCQCGRGARCPKYGVPIERPRRPLIQIGIPADTLLGIQESPAFLAGYGPIDAALARILAEHAHFQAIPEQSDIDDPTTAEEAAQWRPTPRLEREVRAVDGMCRFPGCAMPAVESELDHNHPFDRERPSRGGPTARTNLAVLCGRHHRLKTLADKEKLPWTVSRADLERLQWTAPTGDIHTTVREGGKYLFSRTDTGAPAAPHLGVHRSEQAMDPPRALPDRPTAEEMAYPLNGYVVVHGQLRRIPPEDEIPDDRPEPARKRAQ
ncbi:DUF222 domain-containing protein [Nocardia sp. NBC_01009]|uniref:HNH endonuclease signature motif containing protein n=1 Tax=Nocardia sp. NBC_01009 TaxID=2975996 RepID=UPI0038702262|nr:HNH endonuclease [Nocardia sp. NBC_01009]